MQRTSRKREHIQYALETGQSGNHGFTDVKFVPNCIPESSFSSVSLATTFGGLHLSSPIIINAMTGGASETLSINEKLAALARERNLAMAVGSQMAAIKDSTVRDSYEIVRKTHPKGIIFANLGGEATPAQALQAIEMIEADALQIHLNVMQELIMPEGDRDFRHLLDRLQRIVEAVPCPVFIKEVGFGISQGAAGRLLATGIKGLDVGGSGGTNFAKIENERRQDPRDMFNEWGMSTVQSLMEVSCFRDRVDIMATGGIRNGLEVAKALALGASSVGMAGYFLELVLNQSKEQSLHAIDDLHDQIRTAMTALGIHSTYDFITCPLVISGSSYHWASMRGLDCSSYSQRNKG